MDYHTISISATFRLLIARQNCKILYDQK